MKYQLLLFTIYLITIEYYENTCEPYKSSDVCEAETENNCEWRETTPGSCNQKVEDDCTNYSFMELACN